MLRNSADGAARPVAQEHEADEEDGGEQRAPEDDRPAVLDRQETGERAAETPDDGRAEHQCRALCGIVLASGYGLLQG
jgi:hypothetical protein